VHLIYALTSDGVDEHLDTEGATFRQ